MFEFLILSAAFLFVVMSFFGLRSIHKSKITTAMDNSSPTGRVTGYIHYHGRGYPYVFLETKEYREYIIGKPEPDEIATVRRAGKEMMADYDSSGRRWHIGVLFINLIVYLAAGSGISWFIYIFWIS